MLFNSYEFIFFFLPLAVAGFYLVSKVLGPRAARVWIVACSLFFYGWWDYRYVALLLSSVFVNYGLGLWIDNTPEHSRRARVIVGLGVVFNLGLLGYYKYANFFVDSLNMVVDTNFTLERIILPLGISFFTFQQIGMVVDAYRGITRERSFLNYCLFVTAFWQLIAGPIVHHRQIMPQFRDESTYRFNGQVFATGITVFTIGLFKKLVLADSLSVYANPVFLMPEQGLQPTFLEAWIGGLCYMTQVYFDFSGYSDMAIGIGRMFNIKVPTNFNSPFKSVGIIQFWRRWHITLSLFLREYCYYVLGGNRAGRWKKYRNLMITMILAGWWHGAWWTFIIFGVIHGVMLIANHLFREVRGKTRSEEYEGVIPTIVCTVFTFALVCLTLVLFRAETVAGAWQIWESMFGVHGWSMASSIGRNWPLLYFAIGLFIVWFLPNTNQFMNILGPGEDWSDEVQFGLTRYLRWSPTPFWATVTAVMFVVAIINLPKANVFLYFQF